MPHHSLHKSDRICIYLDEMSVIHHILEGKFQLVFLGASFVDFSQQMDL